MLVSLEQERYAPRAATVNAGEACEFDALHALRQPVQVVGSANEQEGAVGEADCIMKAHAPIACGVGDEIATERHVVGRDAAACTRCVGSTAVGSTITAASSE